MTLTDKAQSVLSRLHEIEATRDGVAEAKALDEFHNQLFELAAPINQQAQHYTLLLEEGVNFSPIGEIGTVIEAVQKVSMRFNETLKATTLKQGKSWAILSEKLSSLAQKVKLSQAQDWKNFFDNNFFGGLPPTQRKAKLASTPENVEAIKRYSELYHVFISYKSKAPIVADEFIRLRSLSEQLTQIKFQEDVPDDVRKFFEATSTGANLELITLEVLGWLRQNDLLCNYVVRAKTN